MKRHAGLLVLVLAFASCKAAAKSKHLGPADAYRSVPWGTSEAKAAKRIKFDTCGVMKEPFLDQPQRSCTSTFQIGDAVVTDELRFVGDRLLFVNGKFTVKDWTEFRDAFIAKYGPPTNSETTSDHAWVSWEINGTSISIYFPFGSTYSADGIHGTYLEWSRELQEREAAAKLSKANRNKKAL